MKQSRTLPANLMWDAVVECDAGYDGIFYYAVKTTGIFCRPSCKSKTPNAAHVSFFYEAEDALEAGYRPCKRCRPDWGSVYNHLDGIIEDTKRVLEKEYHQNISLKHLSTLVGISPYHLNRLFKNETGMTPRQYLESMRMAEAKRMLLSSGLSNADIAFEVGYQSLSSFYSAFKRSTGCSPAEYKLQNHE